MSDFRVKDLKEILNHLPDDAKVFQSSGERESILYIESKNGRKYWTICKDGKVK